jgi:hypothetical protein
MTFCTDFDERLASQGPAALFLPDRDGLLRFDPEWTRGAWGRIPGPHGLEPCWALLRDHDTGFVMMVFSSAKSLIREHPKMDVRLFGTEAEARSARTEWGNPPLCEDPW